MFEATDSMGGTEAFPSLGQHCAYEACHQLDFLPFKCYECSKVFCKDHRGYSDHRCPNGYSTDCKVVFCYDCGKSVKAFGGAVASALEQHRAECKPSGSHAQKRTKCPVKGCKETLTTSNRVHCRDCRRDVCLKHRFASDHMCPKLQLAAAASKTGSVAPHKLAAQLRACGAEGSSTNPSEIQRNGSGAMRPGISAH